MSLEKNKDIVRRVTDAENDKNLAVLDDLISPDYFDNTLKLRGPEGYRQFLSSLFNAFPDWFEVIEDMIAEGNKVCVILQINTGIHKGVFRGLSPTGKKSTHKSIQIWHIVDGKVTEKESIYDQVEFLTKLGVIEYTEKGKQLFSEEN
jgi:steroid delta-isomerase-like uncharacterized protein